MARTGFLVSVVCAAAAFGGGLATLVLVNTSNSRPYDRGDHPHTEAAALQHRLAVVETQLAEVTATVAMLTTTIGTDTDTVSSSSSSNRRRLVTGDFTLRHGDDYVSEETSAPTDPDTADDTADGTSNGDYDYSISNGDYSFSSNGDYEYSAGGNDSDDSAPPLVSDRYTLFLKERFDNWMKRPDDAPAVVLEDEVEATLPPDNDLVCTPFRTWLLQSIFRYDAEDDRLYLVDTNRTVRFYCPFLSWSEEHEIHTHTHTHISTNTHTHTHKHTDI